MNSSRYHKEKKCLNASDHDSIEKIDANDSLESTRGTLIDALAKGRKFKATYDVTEILSGLSKWSSTEAREDR
jgi:hypothetical protein